MAQIARAQQITLPLLAGDQAPQETRFGSLGFAVPVMRFSIFDDGPVPLTIGDVIKAYENVLA